MKLTAYIAVMAIVTYVIRALPITIFHREIKSRWLKAFLYYIPYAVLGAMTFPVIFFSTGSVLSASLGLAAALTAAFFDAGLTVTAITAVLISFIFGFFI